MNYTIGYFDFGTNTLKSSENLYTDISVAAYDLNFTISELILKKYDILLRNSFLFVCKDEFKDSVNNIKINKDVNIVTEKKGLEINIFFINEKKGYIYNTNNKEHVYKFFINKHNHMNESLIKPFEVKESSSLNEKDDDTKNIEKVLLTSNKIKLSKEYTTPELSTLVEQDEDKEEIIMVENWLNKNDIFVKELSEKIKKYKVD